MDTRLSLILLLTKLVMIQSVWGSWDGVNFPFKSTSGQECLSACETRGYSYFWCYTDSSWDYCSPQRGVDMYGEKCVDECGFRGSSYSWCHLELGGWGKCGQIVNEEPKGILQYTSTKVKYCLSECKKGGKSYNSCRVKKEQKKDPGWDYCSAQPGYDAYGNKCRNECGKHGGSRLTCETQNDSRSPCGYIYARDFYEYTVRGTRCISPCTDHTQIRSWSKFPSNKCYDDGWSHQDCSILPGLDQWNQICSSKCDFEGGRARNYKSTYRWCSVNSKDSYHGWGYCAPENGTLARNNTTGVTAILSEYLQGGHLFRQIDNLMTRGTAFYEEFYNQTFVYEATDEEKQGCLKSVYLWLNDPLILPDAITHQLAPETNVDLQQDDPPFLLHKRTKYVNLKCVAHEVGDQHVEKGVIADVTFPTAFVKNSGNFGYIIYAFAHSTMKRRKVHLGFASQDPYTYSDLLQVRS